MRRIVIHWTAGIYTPNSIEKEHYHYLIGYEPSQRTPKGKAKVYEGIYKPEDNFSCRTRYAAHTAGGNTSSIGVAICGMLGFVDMHHIGDYPIKPVQAEACYDLCAKLCRKYNIPVQKNTVLTHYEFGRQHPYTKSKGKPDIMYLAPNPSLCANEIGDYMRAKIQYYINKQKKKEEAKLNSTK